jgi:small subunit ribosomal protein S5
MIKATFDAFSSMHSPRNVANKRGKKVAEIFGNNPKANDEEIASDELAKAE